MSKPDISSVEPIIRDGVATGGGQYGSFVQDLYYLAIVDLSIPDLKQILKNDIALSIGPSSAVRDNKSPEYAFRLPPRVHEFTEPFATNIVGTQNGGKYVESHGSPIKDIRLSGTTGFRPHRNDSKSLKVFGIDTKLSGPLAQSINLAGLNATPNLAGTLLGQPSAWGENEALGHDDIMFLRNMFRLYAWHKDNGPRAGSVVMLWRNYKDADYWIVEPTEFRLAQTSGAPLSYEYSISLRTLARWDHKIKVELAKDPQAVLKAGRSFIARVNQSSAVIRNSFLVVANQTDRLSRIPFNVTTFVLGPMAACLEGATAVQRSEKRFDDLFRASLIQTRDNLKTYRKAANFILPMQDEIVNALRKAQQAAERLLADPDLQPTSAAKVAADNKQNTVDTYNSAFENITVGAGGGSTFIGNQALGTNISQTIVQPGDTIRSLAGRLLGDRQQYHSLALLNNLQAPYISPTRRVGVLQPGDTILFPVEGTNEDQNFGLISSLTKSLAETGTSLDVNPAGAIEQLYGRDFRLVVTESTMFGDKMDIVPDQNGDISTIVGVSNVSQAILLKFSIRRGELIMHKFFGAAFPIGSKATPATMAGFRIDVEQTLLSDPRIVDIRELNFLAVGDTLSARASVALASLSSTARLTFPLRKL